MKSQINLITIWTDNIKVMKDFYSAVLGFKTKNELDSYVEFENPGARFAICTRDVMFSHNITYKEKAAGQSFELANPNDVYESFKKLISLGATHIHEPENMPWNQRIALLADPDGNIHEIFDGL